MHPHGSIQGMYCASPRRPSGYIESTDTVPPPGGGNSKPRPDQPIHLIALNKKTILWITGPTLAAIFAASMFIARAETHMENPDIHVRSESKTEAKEARHEMINVIFERQENAIKAVDLKQAAAVQALSKRLDEDRRKLLRAIRRGR